MSIDFIEEWAALGVSTWRALVDIFDEVGFTDEEREQQSVKLCELVQAICQEQVEAATQVREDALMEFETKQEDIQHLCVLLGKPPAKQQIDENDCIRGKIAALASLHSSLTELSRQRQSQIDEISNQICALGLELDEQFEMDENSAPPGLSEAMIKMLQQKASELQHVKTNRTQTIKELAEQCHKRMKFMCIAVQETSDPDLATQIYSFADEQRFEFALHQATIDGLNTMQAELAEEEGKRKAALTELGEKIGRLWTLLEVSEVERAEFQRSFTDHLSLATIRAGQEELERLHVLKRQNMAKILGREREDIEAMWAELGVPPHTQREEFPLFFADLGSLEESALTDYEQYAEVLRGRLEALRPLLAKVQKREMYISDRLEYEQLIMNPERLMARGPNASKMRKREEEMAKRVKLLKKLDDDLTRTITAWQEQNNQVFTFQGMRYFDRMAAQQRQYDSYKQILRNVSKERRKTEKEPMTTTSRASSHTSSSFNSSTNSAFELPEPPALESFFEESDLSVHVIDVQCDVSFATQTSTQNQENTQAQANTSFSAQAPLTKASRFGGGMRPSVANSDTTEPTVVAERL